MDIQPSLKPWIEETLREMQLSSPVGEKVCPHCGLNIRYPIIARQDDIDRFEKIMQTACRVMDDYGITANLLAEIRARCMINLSMKDKGT